MKIGIFDSGIGGLSVLYEAMQLLPHEQFIYYLEILKMHRMVERA